MLSWKYLQRGISEGDAYKCPPVPIHKVLASHKAYPSVIGTISWGDIS